MTGARPAGLPGAQRGLDAGLFRKTRRVTINEVPAHPSEPVRRDDEEQHAQHAYGSHRGAKADRDEEGTLTLPDA